MGVGPMVSTRIRAMRRPDISSMTQAAAVDDGLAGDGEGGQLEEKESREGFDAGFAGEGPAELGAEVAESGAAVEGHDAFGVEAGSAGRDVELVFQFADDLLQGIFGRDDADGGAELVHDDRDLAAAGLKVLEQFDGELGFGHNEDVAHDLAEGEAGVDGSAEAEGDRAEVHEAGDVLGVDDADDAVGVRDRACGWDRSSAAGRFLVDGDARVLLLDDAAGAIDGHVRREREDFPAGSE